MLTRRQLEEIAAAIAALASEDERKLVADTLAPVLEQNPRYNRIAFYHACDLPVRL